MLTNNTPSDQGISWGQGRTHRSPGGPTTYRQGCSLQRPMCQGSWEEDAREAERTSV